MDLTSSTAKEEVVIVEAVRTPITRAKKGGFKDTTPDDLLTAVFEAILQRTGIDPEEIEDICVGNVLQAGAGVMSGRIAQIQAGIPAQVPFYVVNRQCSSGLQAVANIASSIQSGYITCGIAAGVESMSKNSMGAKNLDANFKKVMANPRAAACLIPMGITSENVAEKYDIYRRDQDALAVRSHELAAVAQKQGLFRREIVPVKTTIKDKEGKLCEITVEHDEGIRPGTTIETLSSLKPAFKPDGSTTAGNASQVSDGAAACLLMSGTKAKELGVKVMGILKSYAVVGVPPEVMGIGPAYAIPEALSRANLTIDDIDIFEINEAFASQATFCVNFLNIPLEKVNPLGGAIALGHPLGCTGNRQVATLLNHLRREGKRYGIVSMCIGTGMGAAAVFECLPDTHLKSNL